MATKHHQDLEMEDILRDPTKFGLASFKDYCEKPEVRDRLLGKTERPLECVDQGSTNLNRHPVKMKFKFNGFNFETLEALQSAAKDEGYDPWELNFIPKVVDMTANTVTIIVEFFGKRKSDILIGV